MSFTQEVKQFFAIRGIRDDLSQGEKDAIIGAALATFPISLDPLSCFDEHIANVDLDAWNACSVKLKDEAQRTLQDECYYLFVLAHPKSFLVFLPKLDLLDVLFDSDFLFSFSVFSEDQKDFILEDHSGILVGQGRFAHLLDTAREACL